ncbi:hypothetical protein HMPREF1989_01298 [Porphyromonas gingivalis F0566]|uniref:Uncharacterized protein n=1 Tax=Porphyromonas gingivalis F0570 TaxID=1227271 RepID=A0A0E2LNS4_PORGN|nr:hypothetical protein HMPREF1555_01714 [Porphyromonas gingivalis F0570]ERJ65346.1 hypothetical protein HMPREF1553_02137 [Porphyromonas gingivalis F0568]ERJ86381.1 hypothetical protein HMPREF1989_01298 [Porphyromonas gingivalis F0566]
MSCSSLYPIRNILIRTKVRSKGENHLFSPQDCFLPPKGIKRQVHVSK